MPTKKQSTFMSSKNSTMTITKVVGAREFISLSKSGKITSSQMVLPKLGSDKLGAFKVTFNKR